ncbi:His Kinase A (phospho-acceptor) domain-containing protein [Streptosporangium subroseum]|uniref:histidine kinase n=1 Tax=Streptosporangium subroseum TaxID=106412 RepID=A0A239EG44_9ACTN|nr:His Kinase A (phospho-acceptor) domain-containing protein [Streptosporangium subroseum]
MTTHSGPRLGRGAPRPAGEGRTAPAIQIPSDIVRELQCELQKKQRFVSDTSHELRTAVAGLRTEVEEALLHPDETDLCRLLANVLRNVERLNAIITDLHVLSELEVGPPNEPQRIDLAELVHDEIARRADCVAVQLRLETGVTIAAIPIRISRVLTNLLDNAQRHARRDIEVRVSHDGDCAELTVTDDGEGVAESERERIFQRFTRLEAACRLDHAGTGLGLAIARDIAQAHVGSLHVREAETGGACFVLRLPLAGSVAPVVTALDP